MCKQKQIKRILQRITLCVVLLAMCVLCGCGSTPPDTPSTPNKPAKPQEETRVMTNHAVYDGVELPDSLWTAPAYVRDEQNDRTDKQIKGSIQAIYYRSDYNGQESYAFAFLGIPEGVSATDKAPAVLLVHGGGGTAYWQWVCEWVNRGYVALAMDLEGHVPKPAGTSDNMPADLYTASEYTAPHNQNYGDASLPIEQTWMYYAVSTAIRGNSLLHSLDCVNKYKIGVCGVSWGGVIASIITGYDDRFAFSVPIYCSLNLAESGGGNLTSYYKNHSEARVWDDADGLAQVKTPLLLLAMDNDPNAYADSLSWTVEACKNAQISLVRGWAHSHTHAFGRPEPYAFADSIVKGDKGLIKISKPSGASGTLTLTVPEGITVKNAYIGYIGGDMSHVPAWDYSRLSVNGNKIAYEITDEMKSDAGGEVTWYYIYVTDSANRITSTVAVEL